MKKDTVILTIEVIMIILAIVFGIFSSPFVEKPIVDISPFLSGHFMSYILAVLIYEGILKK